jgi:hypothetical protein
MIEIHEPGALADAIDVELARFEQVGRVYRVPAALGDQAEALERVATMLREAERRGQEVDLGEEVVQLLRQFRGAMRAVGGAAAEA